MRQPWAPADVQYLHEHVADPLADIAHVLGRSVSAVKAKRRNVGACHATPRGRMQDTVALSPWGDAILAGARAVGGITLLADRLGVHPPILFTWRDGVDPSLRSVWRVAWLMHVDIDGLARGEWTPDPHPGVPSSCEVRWPTAIRRHVAAAGLPAESIAATARSVAELCGATGAEHWYHRGYVPHLSTAVDLATALGATLRGLTADP